MRTSPRGLTPLAVANVIVGAVSGWWYLFMMAAGDGFTRDQLAPGMLQAVLQIFAGLALLDQRAWAHRYLLALAPVTLVRTVPPLVALVATSIARPTAEVLTWVGLWSLATPAVAAFTLWCLVHPQVRALFPPLPRSQRIAIDTVAVLLVLWTAITGIVVTRPRAPEQVAVARPARRQAVRELPRYSPEPIAPGTGPVTLVPMYDGKPVGDFTAADVRLTLTAIEEKSFYDSKGVKRSYSVNSLGTIERPWRVRHGRIRIASIPAGRYQVALAIDRNRDNGPGDVGDLGSGGTRVELRTGHGPVREVVPLQYRFALREPKTAPDPASDLTLRRAYAVVGGLPADEFDRLPRVQSPARFAWDEVPSAVKYQVMLFCHAFPDPVQKIVHAPSWTTDLPHCPPPHPWRGSVSAIGSSGALLGGANAGAFVVEGTRSSRGTRGLRPATLTLRPTFDGRLLGNIDERDVSLALLPPRTLEAIRPPVRVRHGRIKIPRLVPDHYSLWMVIGPDARGRGGYQVAGDLVATGDRPIRQLRTDWQPESRVVEVQRTMQLVEPEPPVSCGYWPTHVQSPVDLRWEPVPEAVEYTLEMTRTREARAEAQKFVVRQPSWRGTLASSGPDGGYMVKVAARTAKGTDVAQLQYHLVVD